jgi:hypothetical protein
MLKEDKKINLLELVQELVSYLTIENREVILHIGTDKIHDYNVTDVRLSHSGEEVVITID